MTRRTVILGIITILVVTYGAWDTIQSRSSRRSIKLMENEGGAKVSSLQNSRNMLPALPSSSGNLDASLAGENPGRSENPSWLSAVADLTEIQRQRAKARWGRDPFVRTGSEQGGRPGNAEGQYGRGEGDQALVLNGVVRFGARHIAIINDKTYLPGNVVGGWRVGKIHTDRVIVEKGEERLTLVVHRLREIR